MHVCVLFRTMIVESICSNVFFCIQKTFRSRVSILATHIMRAKCHVYIVDITADANSCSFIVISRISRRHNNKNKGVELSYTPYVSTLGTYMIKGIYVERLGKIY